MLGVVKAEDHKIKFNSYLTSHKFVEDLMLYFSGMGGFEICIVDSLTLLVQESPKYTTVFSSCKKDPSKETKQ